MRVLMAGGGTGGPTTPLLAIAHVLRRQLGCEVDFLFVGTFSGPEKVLVPSAGIPFAAVHAGKLRRYWDIQNFVDPARVILGFLESLALVRRFSPDVAVGAGSFVSVPVLLAARVLGVPFLVHQQDVQPGLANRLLSPLARRVTVSLPESTNRFSRRKTILTGNPVREEVLRGDPERFRSAYGLTSDAPIVLVTGGGTGAVGLNRLIASAAPALVEFCQVVHLTGRDRSTDDFSSPRYRRMEFLTSDMRDALALADLVITRAGMATLSELAVLGKPIVAVPMPGSHQEANAEAFARRGAAILVRQEEITAQDLVALLRGLLRDRMRLERLGAAARAVMPADAAERVAREVLAIGGNHRPPRSG